MNLRAIRAVGNENSCRRSQEGRGEEGKINEDKLHLLAETLAYPSKFPENSKRAVVESEAGGKEGSTGMRQLEGGNIPVQGKEKSEKKKDALLIATHPSFRASNITGAYPRTYVAVHIRSNSTTSNDSKLKIADCHIFKRTERQEIPCVCPRCHRARHVRTYTESNVQGTR